MSSGTTSSYTELTTGLRRGELCGLKWEDFDSNAGTLKICHTIRTEKGGALEAGDTKTNALEHGMDIKTLSAVIGHVSSATTLNVYAHVTDEMRQSAAAKIDRAIARVEPQPEPAIPKKPGQTTFQAVKGKRMARNIYAPSEEECEEKLAQLIREMKIDSQNKTL